MAKYEPPKPEVLTREGLHRRVDDLLEVSALSKSDSYSPVILPKWEYEHLIWESGRLKELTEELMEERRNQSEQRRSELKERMEETKTLLRRMSGTGARTKKKSGPILSLVSADFEKFRKASVNKDLEGVPE